MTDQILLYMPAWGMLFNINTRRYHPILFHGAPFPGGVDAGRYRSHGHHTNGVDTLEEAIEWIKINSTKIVGGVKYYTPIMHWDGHDMPALSIIVLDSELIDSLDVFAMALKVRDNETHP